jgi:hypothetical protein
VDDARVASKAILRPARKELDLATRSLVIRNKRDGVENIQKGNKMH